VSQMRYVARATNIAARMIGDEMMIMSGRDSSLFSLNATASLLWQAADGVTPLAEIVERHICATFDVEPATALRDAEELAEDLARHGILRLSDAPISDAATLGRTVP
jgi:hypothetical protein